MTRSEIDVRRANAARRNVVVQRAIKRQARRLRRRIEVPPASPESVPILVRDVGTELRFPAGERELRAVLRRLPGRLDGLNGIELTAHRDRDALEEILPGVRAPRILGAYHPELRVVHLHGYVCEQAPAPFLSAYLRLRALATLAHELAHHYDATFRTGRDRWRMDDRAKSEAYARERAFEDTRNVVLPALRESDGEALASLSDWIATHAGVAFPLELLIDERATHAHLVDHGFRELVRRVDAGEPTRGLAVFAAALHCAAHDEHAETIARLLQAREPRAAALLLARIEARKSPGRGD